MLQKPYKRMTNSKGAYIVDEFGRFKYLIRFRLAGRGSREIKRRVFLKDDFEAAAMIAKMRGNMAGVSDTVTWAEALALFFENKPNLSKTYRHDTEYAVNYIVENTSKFVEKTTLAAYSRALREKAKASSARRANNIRISTMSVARHARAEGLILDIPFEHAAPRPEKREGKKPFPVERLGEYFDALDAFARPIFLALAASGERVSAMCGANVSGIDKTRGVLTVTKKGGKLRDIPLSPLLLQALDMALALKPKSGRRDAEAIFVHFRGRRWNKFSVRDRLVEACKKTGLPYHSPHTLRNMISSSLADGNASRDTISASLGHDDTSTADIYVKAREKLRSAERGLKTWGDVLSTALGGRVGRTLAAQTPEIEAKTTEKGVQYTAISERETPIKEAVI